jgi:hypothetical protein
VFSKSYAYLNVNQKCNVAGDEVGGQHVESSAIIAGPLSGPSDDGRAGARADKRDSTLVHNHVVSANS